MLEKIIAAVRQAGGILLSAHEIGASVSEKEGSGNFVTEYDVRVQEFLRERLLAILPEAHFIGEEEAAHESACDGWAFIVDPIDCTANFIRGMKHSAVSVALAHDGVLEYAAVYNPYRAEMFYAQRGEGAFLNGQPIHVSSRPMAEGIFCFGASPYDRSLHDSTWRLTRELMRRMQDLRRFGSAALDLCDVACGRMELSVERVLQPWDYAAGALIVTEAGGCASRIDGSPLALDCAGSVLTGNPAAWQSFFDEGLDRVE